MMTRFVGLGLCGALGLILASPVSAQSAPVCTPLKRCAITWVANTEPDMHEYHLLLSKVTGQYDPAQPPLVVLHPNTGSLTANLGALVGGQYFAVLVAVDQVGNVSPYSNEVTFVYDGPPGAPVIQVLEVVIP